MTTEEMLAEIDAMIGRRQKARAILASLGTGPTIALAVPAMVTEKPEDISVPAPAAVSVTVLKPRVRRDRSSRRPALTTTTTALSGAVPAGPIAVPPPAAATSRQTEPEEKLGTGPVEGSSAEPGYSLEDLVREMEGKKQTLLVS